MNCPARQLCNYFTSTILLTTDFCGTIPRATIKTTNLMQWHGTICIVKVFLLSEREISPNCTGVFLDFVHGFGSYVKGLPKTKRWNLVAVTVSVRFRFEFGVYVKQPLSHCWGTKAVSNLCICADSSWLLEISILKCSMFNFNFMYSVFLWSAHLELLNLWRWALNWIFQRRYQFR